MAIPAALSELLAPALPPEIRDQDSLLSIRNVLVHGVLDVRHEGLGVLLSLEELSKSTMPIYVDANFREQLLRLISLILRVNTVMHKRPVRNHLMPTFQHPLRVDIHQGLDMPGGYLFLVRHHTAKPGTKAEI